MAELNVYQAGFQVLGTYQPPPSLNIYQNGFQVLGTTEVTTPPYVPPVENNNAKNRMMLGVG